MEGLSAIAVFFTFIRMKSSEFYILYDEDCAVYKFDFFELALCCFCFIDFFSLPKGLPHSDFAEAEKESEHCTG